MIYTVESLASLSRLERFELARREFKMPIPATISSSALTDSQLSSLILAKQGERSLLVISALEKLVQSESVFHGWGEMNLDKALITPDSTSDEAEAVSSHYAERNS